MDTFLIMKNSNKPLVSIIMPVFNGELFVKDSIGSVLNQTFENFELIIINDGSNDKSLDYIISFDDPRIILIDQENEGRLRTRNVGLKTARGKYIQYLDQDDILHKDKLLNQVNDLTDEDETIISMGELRLFDLSPDDDVKLNFFDSFANYIKPMDFLFQLSKGNAVQTSVWLTPKSLHNVAGTWNESLTLNPMDDGELFTRILLKSSLIKFNRKAICYHRRHNNYIRGSTHNNETKVKSYFKSLVLCKEYILNYENSFRTRQICASMFKHFLYLHHNNYPELGKEAFGIITELGFRNVNYKIGGKLFKIIDKFLSVQQSFNLRKFLKKLKNKNILKV